MKNNSQIKTKGLFNPTTTAIFNLVPLMLFYSKKLKIAGKLVSVGARFGDLPDTVACK